MILNDISAILANFVPVDNIPPVRYVLGSTVLVLQIVAIMVMRKLDWLELHSLANAD